MADTTIVNTPDGQDSNSAGFAVAVVLILLAVVVGGFMWYRTYGVAKAPEADSTNINVTIPAPGTGEESTTQ